MLEVSRSTSEHNSFSSEKSNTSIYMQEYE